MVPLPISASLVVQKSVLKLFRADADAGGRTTGIVIIKLSQSSLAGTWLSLAISKDPYIDIPFFIKYFEIRFWETFFKNRSIPLAPSALMLYLAKIFKIIKIVELLTIFAFAFLYLVFILHIIVAAFAEEPSSARFLYIRHLISDQFTFSLLLQTEQWRIPQC